MRGRRQSVRGVASASRGATEERRRRSQRSADRPVKQLLLSETPGKTMCTQWDRRGFGEDRETRLVVVV